MEIVPNIADPDEFYAQLVQLHMGLSEHESLKLNAKIILLLANQIGDPAVLNAVLAAVAATDREPAGRDASGALIRGDA